MIISPDLLSSKSRTTCLAPFAQPAGRFPDQMMRLTSAPADDPGRSRGTSEFPGGGRDPAVCSDWQPERGARGVPDRTGAGDHQGSRGHVDVTGWHSGSRVRRRGRHGDLRRDPGLAVPAAQLAPGTGHGRRGGLGGLAGVGGQLRRVQPAGYRPNDVRLRLPELGREPAVPCTRLRRDPPRTGADLQERRD